MPYLAAITLVWAVSFNLIGVFLAGQVDSDFAVLTRVALAGLVFLPFTRWRQQAPGRVLGTMLAGALQFGLTYLCLYRSFRFLSVAEVLLFTIFTPIYVTLLDDLLQRRFQPRAFVAALVAVVGSLVIRYDHIDSNALTGFFAAAASQRDLCRRPGRLSLCGAALSGYPAAISQLRVLFFWALCAWRYRRG